MKAMRMVSLFLVLMALPASDALATSCICPGGGCISGGVVWDYCPECTSVCAASSGTSTGSSGTSTGSSGTSTATPVSTAGPLSTSTGSSSTATGSTPATQGVTTQFLKNNLPISTGGSPGSESQTGAPYRVITFEENERIKAETALDPKQQIKRLQEDSARMSNTLKAVRDAIETKQAARDAAKNLEDAEKNVAAAQAAAEKAAAAKAAANKALSDAVASADRKEAEAAFKVALKKAEAAEAAEKAVISAETGKKVLEEAWAEAEVASAKEKDLQTLLEEEQRLLKQLAGLGESMLSEARRIDIESNAGDKRDGETTGTGQEDKKKDDAEYKARLEKYNKEMAQKREEDEEEKDDVNFKANAIEFLVKPGYIKNDAVERYKAQGLTEYQAMSRALDDTLGKAKEYAAQGMNESDALKKAILTSGWKIVSD